MTNAWFLGATHSVGQTEEEARSTVEPIRQDNSTIEMPDAPEFNQFDTDQSGELVGLSPRPVIGPTTDEEQYSPWWAALASTPHNIITDSQVASSGTAARREEAGQQGHGTMQYTESMEPLIRDGAAYGNEYFVVPAPPVQEGMGAYMSPVQNDNWGSAVAQARANTAAKTNPNYAALLR